jgi:imidazole glycerol phosphate synthase glutamine amidotransferase subunit
VSVVPTGTANLASVCAALRRIGAEPRLVDHPADVTRARVLVLPGVGTFRAAMQALASRQLVEAIRAHCLAGSPLLAICLGLQLLAEGSEESPGVQGLGVIGGVAQRLPATVRVPQLGWNRVTWHDDPTATGFGYFAHSYSLADAPSGWMAAHAHHGTAFVAAIRRGPQMACQFHPELSGSYGDAVLRSWWSGC